MTYRSVRFGLAICLASGLSFVVDGAPGGSASGEHSALLMPDGNVWTAGHNTNGEVGDGTTEPRRYRVQVFSGATSVAVGYRHTLAAAGGSAYAWGRGMDGQLCDDLAVAHSAPTPVPGPSGVVQVAAADFSSFFMLGDGTVRSCGANGNGILGDGTDTARRVPVPVAGVSDAIAIAAGPEHVLVLRATGTVLAWGRNTYGRLGDGTTTDRWTPVPVTGLTNVTAIAAGSDFSAALDAAGHVWVWGTGFHGIGGDGTTTDHLTPYQVPGLANITKIAAGDSKAIVLDSSNQVRTWGGGLLGHGVTQGLKVPTVIAGLPLIAAVAAGNDTTFAFAVDGTVYGWGRNAFGLLGDGTDTDALSPIVLADANGVWRTGTPVFSPAGGSTYATEQTVQITSASPGGIVRYTTTGEDPTEADPIVPVGGLLVDQNRALKARAWKAGQGPSYVASATFTLQPGLPTVTPGTGTYTSARTVTITTATTGAVLRYTTDGAEPTAASPAYSSALAISTGTTLKAKAFKTGWTDSFTRTATYSFNYGTIDTPVISPGAGAYSTDQTVSITAPTAPGGAVIRYTTTGSDPNTSSTLYTGPITVAAGLTLKTRVFHPDWTPSTVASAAYAFTAATPTFTAASGTYPAGQIVAIATNTPNATIRYTLNGAAPTVNDAVFLPGQPLTIGDYTLKATAWRTGFTTSAIAAATYQITGDVTPPQITAGDTHTLVVSRDGTIWGFGSNGWGYLGDNSTTPRSLPVRAAGVTGIKDVAAGYLHSLAVGLDGRVYSFGTNSSGQQGDGATNGYRMVPWPVPAVTNAVAVAAGQNHSLALTNTGEVYAWGANASGQLGLGFASSTHSPTPTLIPGLSGIVGIAAGESHSLAWTASGALYAWGNNGNGRLGDNSTTQRTSPVLIAGITGVAEAAAGRYHTIALTTSGQVFTWGRNTQGQLGLGNTTDRWVPTQVTALSGIQAVGAGHNHTLASTATTTYAWGQNTSSQVGDGLTANRTSPYATTIGASVELTGGSVHSVALDVAGTVWTWGGNGSGQLGIGGTTPQTAPGPISGPGQTWGVAAPTATPTAGLYGQPQTVTLQTMTPGATIRYTIDGADPTANDAVATDPIAIAQNAVLRARAWKGALDPSAVGTFRFDFQPSTPAVTPAGGTFTNSTTVTLSGPSGSTLRYTLDGTDPTDASAEYSAPFQVTTSLTLKAQARRSGWTPSAIAQATFVIDEAPATPTIYPGTGTYSSEQTVMITSPTPGVIVRYTADGTEPSEGAPAISGPLSVAHTSTLKAKSFKVGYPPSPSATAVLTFNYGKLSTPIATPPAGTFATSQQVMLSSDSGATIRYTLDGSGPSSSSPLYTGAVTVSMSTVLKARAYRDDWTPSDTLSATYTINAPRAPLPTISPNGGVFTESVQVAIAGQPADELRYTLDGTTPTADSALYAGPLTVSLDTALKVRAFRTGVEPSDEVSANFRFAIDSPNLQAPAVSPARATLVIDDVRAVRAVDRLGRALQGVVWTVQDPTVAEVVDDDDSRFVRALSTGQTTVSATTPFGTATMNVTVVGAMTSTGTELWHIDAVDESSTGTAVLEAQQTGTPGPELYASDYSSAHPFFGGAQITTIRALTSDGVEVWRRYLPDSPKLAASGDGALLVYDRNGITKLDALSGTDLWTRTPGRGLVKGMNVSVAADGAIIVGYWSGPKPDWYYYHSPSELAELHFFVGRLDGTTGAMLANAEVPVSSETLTHCDGSGTQSLPSWGAASPVSDRLGNSYFVVGESHKVTTLCGTYPTISQHKDEDWDWTLVKLSSTGAVVETPLHNGAVSYGTYHNGDLPPPIGTQYPFLASMAIGQNNDFLLSWGIDPFGSEPPRPQLWRVASDGTMAQRPTEIAQLTVGTDGAVYGTSYNGHNVMRLDNLDVQWSRPVQPVAGTVLPMEGGGVAVVGYGMPTRISADGVVSTIDAALGSTTVLGDFISVGAGATRIALDESVGGTWLPEVGNAGVQRIVTQPTITGPSSVTRGNTATFRVRNATVLGWVFKREADARLIPRTAGLDWPFWSGKMAAGGTVTVSYSLGGSTKKLAHKVDVVPRTQGWFFPAVEPVEVANGTDPFVGDKQLLQPPLLIDGNEDASRAGLSLPSPKIGHWSSVTISDDGPNHSLAYWHDITDGSTFKWTMSGSLKNPGSEFMQRQCGNYNYNQALPWGFISGPRLLSNIIQHEAGRTGQSHWTFYKQAQDEKSNNLKSVLETQVEFGADALITASTQVYLAAIDRIQKANVEPCDGTGSTDGADNCKYHGPQNVSGPGRPYAECP